MLTIKRFDIEEEIAIGELFEQLQFTQNYEPTDEGGDSVKDVIDWNIKTLTSNDVWNDIQAFRWTKNETLVNLIHCDKDITDTVKDLRALPCSPEHMVMRMKPNYCEWVKVQDLTIGDVILSLDDYRVVVGVKQLDVSERLCDIQVDKIPCYYADGILSHNSHMLTALGANAIRNGVNVLHYSTELSETAIARRYDSNLCDIDSNEIFERKDEVIKKYSESSGLGSLYVKQYPPNTATIYTLRSHIERCVMNGFIPGMIIVDYADTMRSTRQFDSLRHELKLVYEELRGMADELKIPLWSASQSNKDGASSDIVDLTNMSESYSKAMVADIVISLSRRSHEKATGIGRLYIAKNRAGKDGLVYPLNIDTARSKFKITGGCSNLEAENSVDENDMKRRLREKMKELDNDKILNAKKVQE